MQFSFQNGFTRQKLYSVAIQQDQYLRQLYVSDVSVFSSDMFIFVDETGTDKRNLQRTFAYSICGKPLRDHSLFMRGERISSIAAISRNGLIDVKTVHGTTDGTDFYDFINSQLLPHLLPFNGINHHSIVVLDNCSIMCSKKGLNDPLFMVMQQSKLCGDRFVRTVTASPEPMCILTNDQQLKDLERFCTNANSFSIVSVDPTCSLGDFSVTCIVYRHLLTKDRRTGESPIMLGPVLVHQRKQFEKYHFFISSLVGFAPHLIIFWLLALTVRKL